MSVLLGLLGGWCVLALLVAIPVGRALRASQIDADLEQLAKDSGAAERR